MKFNTRLLYLLALVKFLLPFILQNGQFEPHRDEFLYLAEGRHMAWGFMEVPPLLSVFAWLTHILGDGFFWIKFWPSLFGAITFILTGKIILSLGGKSFALVLALTPFIFGAYLRVHYLFQPNFLEIFFWTLMVWALVSYIQQPAIKWLYIFGIGLGLGMMSKYSVAFYALSLLAGLTITPQRKLFMNKHFAGALVLALIIFLPNLLWQYYRHFPVVFHMNKLRETQLQYISPGGFLIDQLILFIPCFFVWITGLLFIGFSTSMKPYRFVAWSYVFVIGFLLLFHGKNYYSLGAYPVLFAFGAVQLEKLTQLRYKFWRLAILAVPLVLAYFFIPIALPIMPAQQLADFYEKHHVKKTGLLKWEDLEDHPLPQDFSDMQGWQEMSQKMAAAYNSLDSTEKSHTLLFCDNYGQAGAVNFYAGKYGMPEIYSDNASFLYWIPEKVEFENLVLLTDDQQEMEHAFIKDFKSAILFDSVTSKFAREKGDLIIVLKSPNEHFKDFFIQKLEKDRAKVKW